MNKYEELARTLKFRSSFLGYNFLAGHGEPLKNSWPKKIFVFLIYANLVVTIVSLPFGLYESRDSLHVMVNLTLLGCDAIFSLYAIYILFMYQGPFEEAFFVAKTAHCPSLNTLKVIHKPIFDQAFIYARWSFRITNFFLPLCFMFTIVAGTAFDLFGNNAMYPLPLIFQIAFLKPVDPMSYSLNMINQVLFVTYILLCLWFCMTLFLTNATYGVLSTHVTMELLKRKEEFDIEYSEWLRTTVETITENRRTLGDAIDSFSGFYYAWEKESYLILLISYVMFKTDVTQVGFCLFHLSLPLSMFVVVAFNEYLADKYREIAYLIYDLNWYEWKPVEQKPLMIMLEMAQNPISVTSGGLKDFTYSWYADIVKSAYSAALILEKFLK